MDEDEMDDLEESMAREKQEQEFLAYCKQHDLDPEDEESREEWEENCRQYATHEWDQMDPHDAAGWEDDMNKD